MKIHIKITEILCSDNSQTQLLNAYNTSFAMIPNFPDSTLSKSYLSRLLSSNYILCWIFGKATGEIRNEMSLYELENWIFRDKEFNPQLFTDYEDDQVFNPLDSIEFGDELLDILPYAIEVFETSDEILNLFGQKRKKKKEGGIYYTPSDVADYMVCYSISLKNNSDNQTTWLDPACGTGVFLISVLTERIKNQRICTFEEAIDFINQSLFGIDISAIAIQSAVYILAIYLLFYFPNNTSVTLLDLLKILGKSFLCLDSTTIFTINDLQKHWGTCKDGFDFIITNPPYNWVKMETQQSLPSFQNLGSDKTTRKKIYPHFIKLLTKLTKENNGIGAIVTPLSIAYNSSKEFSKLRIKMIKAKGTWKFAHFDRTPDSLFGDDVKTRNSIIFYIASNYSNRRVFTTDLMRWSSINRGSLFRNIDFTEIRSETLKTQGIPKLESIIGAILFPFFSKRNISLANDIISIKETEKSYLLSNWLRNSRTAYNWLPFEIGSSKMMHSSRYSYWQAKGEKEMYGVFSITHSTISYWWWRVFGDGFHLTNQFIESIPLSLEDFNSDQKTSLSKLGSLLWREMQKNSFVKSNAGVSIPSYNPINCRHLILEIDQMILATLGFDATTCKKLDYFFKENLLAGR